MTDWEPATDVEAAMRDALRAGDQELYFRILARTELLLPVSADALAGRAPVGWGTWTTNGRTHVLAFTSGDALRICLADNAGSARRIAYHELAGSWPNLEWWLAVNPGLPIEGYLPAWFVSQLARGDVRLPGRTMGARARLERAESAARARARATVPGQVVQGEIVEPPYADRVGAASGPVLEPDSIEPAPRNRPVRPPGFESRLAAMRRRGGLDDPEPSSPAPLPPYRPLPAPGHASSTGLASSTGPASETGPTHAAGYGQAPASGSGLGRGPEPASFRTEPERFPFRGAPEPPPLRQRSEENGYRQRPEPNGEPAPWSPPVIHGDLPPRTPRPPADVYPPMDTLAAPERPLPPAGTSSSAQQDAPRSLPPMRPPRSPFRDDDPARSSPRRASDPARRMEPPRPLDSSRPPLTPRGFERYSPVDPPPSNGPSVPLQGSWPVEGAPPGQNREGYDATGTPGGPEAWRSAASRPAASGFFGPPASGGDRPPSTGESVPTPASTTGGVPTPASTSGTVPTPASTSGGPPASTSGGPPTSPTTPPWAVDGGGRSSSGWPSERNGTAASDIWSPARDRLRPSGNDPASAQPEWATATPPDAGLPAGSPVTGTPRDESEEGQPPTTVDRLPGHRQQAPADGPAVESRSTAGPVAAPGEDAAAREWSPPPGTGSHESITPPDRPPLSRVASHEAGGAGSGRLSSNEAIRSVPGRPQPAEAAPVGPDLPRALSGDGASMERAIGGPTKPEQGSWRTPPLPPTTDAAGPLPDAGSATGASTPRLSGQPQTSHWDASTDTTVSAPTETPGNGTAAAEEAAAATPKDDLWTPRRLPATTPSHSDAGGDPRDQQNILPALAGDRETVDGDATGSETATAPNTRTPATNWPGPAGTAATPHPTPPESTTTRDTAAAEVFGSDGVVPVDFQPANDVEESLLTAAGEGSTDTFLSTLLLARVLVPVADGAPADAKPGTDDFVWRTETIDGEPYIVVFTSKERLADHLGAPADTVTVKFVQLISRWPREEWSFAVNPGTPVGAKLPGAQIVALASWAAEVGLGAEDEPVAAAPADGDKAAAPAPEPAAAQATLPTMMQKTVSPAQVDFYLERGYDRVSGFVHRAAEVAHLDTPAKLVTALGLGYANSPFSPDADHIFVLRWPAYRPSLYRIPYGGQNEAAMRAMEGWVIERAPFRGNGFAPGEGTDVIAEFKVDSARLPHGAQLVRVGADGSEKVVAVLDADAPAWRRVGD